LEFDEILDIIFSPKHHHLKAKAPKKKGIKDLKSLIPFVRINWLDIPR